jgi:hypothetical protein
MRLYNQRHRFYASVDLHARSMFTRMLEHRGRTAPTAPALAAAQTRR